MLWLGVAIVVLVLAIAAIAYGAVPIGAHAVYRTEMRGDPRLKAFLEILPRGPAASSS